MTYPPLVDSDATSWPMGKLAPITAAAVAGVVAFAASFAPWFGLSFRSSDAPSGFSSVGVTENAWHGASALAVFLTVVAVVTAVVALGLQRQPGLAAFVLCWVSAGLSVLGAAIELVRLLTIPRPSFEFVTSSVRWGGYLLVIAMIAGAAAAILGALAAPRLPMPAAADPGYGTTEFQTPPYVQPPYPPQAPGQPTYYPPPPGYGYGYAGPPTNTMAILSLILAFVFWPLAIVFGHVARGQIRQTGESGAGLALAGLILGYLALAFTMVGILIVVGLFAANSATI